MCGIPSFAHFNSWIICIYAPNNGYKVPKSLEFVSTILPLIFQTKNKTFCIPNSV